MQSLVPLDNIRIGLTAKHICSVAWLAVLRTQALFCGICGPVLKHSSLVLPSVHTHFTMLHPHALLTACLLPYCTQTTVVCSQAFVCGIYGVYYVPRPCSVTLTHH